MKTKINIKFSIALITGCMAGVLGTASASAVFPIARQVYAKENAIELETSDTYVSGETDAKSRSSIYKVTIPSAGWLAVTTHSIQSGTQTGGLPTVHSVTVSGEKAGETRVGYDFEADFNLTLEKGTYYIELNGSGAYQVKASFTSAGSNENEPNDQFSQAQVIASGKTIKGFLTYNSNPDYYKMELSETANLKIGLKDYCGAECRVYNSKEEELSAAGITSTGRASEDSPANYTENISLDPGTYYFVISSNNYSSLGRYELCVEKNALSTIEQTSAEKGAVKLETNSTYVGGSLGSGTDSDVYEINLSSPGWLTVISQEVFSENSANSGSGVAEDGLRVITHPTGGLSAVSSMSIYGDLYGKRELITSSAGRGLDHSVEKIALEKGVYTIKMEGFGDYQIKASFIAAESNESEPNDQFQQAQNLTLGNQTMGFVSLNNIQDYYKINLSETTDLEVSLEDYAGIDCKIYNGNEEELQDIKISGDKTATENNPSSYTENITLGAGTYYFSISAKDSSYTGRYRLCIKKASTYISGLRLKRQTGSSGPLHAGDKLYLTAVVTPIEADPVLVWTSSDESVATVKKQSGRYVVLAKKPGTAIIKVAAQDGSEKYDTLDIVVESTPVTNISISDTSLEVGNTKQMRATVLPENATDSRVVWKSSNESVVTVSSDGIVKGVAEGNAILTATAADGSGVYGKAVITVNKTVQNKPKQAIVSTSETGSKKDSGKQDTADTTEKVLQGKSKDQNTSDATEKTVQDDKKEQITAGSSNKTSQKTNEKQSTVKSEGKATAATGSSKDAEKPEKTVKKSAVKVTKITIKGSKALEVDDTAKLTATVTPKSATNKKIVWKTNNSKIVSVSNSGKVTAKKAGKVTITAAAADGSGVYGSIKITVKNPSYKITASGNKKIKVTWKKKPAGKLEIQTATNKKFTKNVVTKMAARSKTSATIKRTKTGDTYVRIRVIDKNEHKGKWNAIQKIKTK